MNNIVISGNLGADPEIKYFESGNSVAKFNIAVRRRKKDEAPLWVQCECWNKQAEVAVNYLHKGDNVCVSGEVDIQTWISKQSGEASGRIVVRVSNLDLPSKRQSEEGGEDDEEWDRGSQQTAQRQPVAADKTKTVEPAPEVDYDDIPF